MKKCIFFWQHQWSKWEVYKTFELIRGGVKYGEKIVFIKKCKKCNKVEFYDREIK